MAREREGASTCGQARAGAETGGENGFLPSKDPQPCQARTCSLSPCSQMLMLTRALGFSPWPTRWTTVPSAASTRGQRQTAQPAGPVPCRELGCPLSLAGAWQTRNGANASSAWFHDLHRHREQTRDTSCPSRNTYRHLPLAQAPKVAPAAGSLATRSGVLPKRCRGGCAFERRRAERAAWPCFFSFLLFFVLLRDGVAFSRTCVARPALPRSPCLRTLQRIKRTASRPVSRTAPRSSLYSRARQCAQGYLLCGVCTCRGQNLVYVGDGRQMGCLWGIPRWSGRRPSGRTQGERICLAICHRTAQITTALRTQESPPPCRGVGSPLRQGDRGTGRGENETRQLFPQNHAAECGCLGQNVHNWPKAPQVQNLDGR